MSTPAPTTCSPSTSGKQQWYHQCSEKAIHCLQGDPCRLPISSDLLYPRSFLTPHTPEGNENQYPHLQPSSCALQRDMARQAPALTSCPKPTGCQLGKPKLYIRRGITLSPPPRHLHQKSTCWKLLVTIKSRFPFSFLGSTSMDCGSGLPELGRKQQDDDFKLPRPGKLNEEKQRQSSHGG